MPAGPSLTHPPWPLSAMERYFLSDDRHDGAGRGMSYPVCFRVDRQPDAVGWRAALVAAITRHPLLGCRLQWGRGVPRWVPYGSACAAADAAARQTAPAGRVDPFSGPPLAWSIKPAPGGYDLLFQFHHAAVDGVGALQFLGDWFHDYHRQITGETLRLAAVESNWLAQRGECVFDPPRKTTASSPPRLRISREVQRFFGRRVTAVAAGQQPSPGGSAAPAAEAGVEVPSQVLDGCDHDLFQCELDGPATHRVRQAAERAGVTVNDLAMCCLLLALRDHNQIQGALGRWYRITMPVNLRGRRDKRLPACNRLGYAFIDRDLAAAVDEAELLAGVAEENGLIRDLHLAGSFLGVLDVVTKVPGLLRLVTTKRLRATTAVFSNVGDPIRRFHWRPPHQGGQVRFGDLGLLGFAGAPPVRPGTPASFLLHQWGDRLYLNVLVDTDVIRPTQARGLLARWRSGLSAGQWCLRSQSRR